MTGAYLGLNPGEDSFKGELSNYAQLAPSYFWLDSPFKIKK